MGFNWYRTTLLRVTKFEHPIDYLPREFMDGRTILATDESSSKTADLFKDATDLECVHRPGRSIITASVLNLKFEFTIFMPLEDSCEIWLVKVADASGNARKISLSFEQVWSFAKFGIHTAEDGIPYISTPGKDLKVNSDNISVCAHSTNAELPYEMFGLFQSPQADEAVFTPVKETRADGKEFTFYKCALKASYELPANGERKIEIISGAEVAQKDFEALKNKYNSSGAASEELKVTTSQWGTWLDMISCETPDKNFQHFLNVWFKNQLNLIFHFVRSGQNGYRDSLQDAWGYTLTDEKASEKRLYEILSHQFKDGTAPRSFSSYDDDIHDLRRFMDSPVWISRTLIDLIKETGDFSILDKDVPYLDGGSGSVAEHAWRGLDYLYQNRGAHEGCLTGDGDWNDALEGISKDGDAESIWLTIALYDAMKLLQELCEAAGKTDKAEELKKRSKHIKEIVNQNAWDGEWYVYGFTGSGKPIGSKQNKEGKIHLNAQTWAAFSGLADKERATTAMAAVNKHLGTPLGPVLMSPAYVDEAKEVGRIANLEPGTFENASIYQHAVSFHIFAELAVGNYDEAFKSFVNLLPTNPDNFDSRRTSEPYCTGNYYCGPTHPRFGQNFFTWFTGNAAWLIRAGFDEILGVKAGFNGLEISPKAPSDWNSYSVKRKYRNCDYNINFIKKGEGLKIILDGKEIAGNILPLSESKKVNATVY